MNLGFEQVFLTCFDLFQIRKLGLIGLVPYKMIFFLKRKIGNIGCWRLVEAGEEITLREEGLGSPRGAWMMRRRQFHAEITHADEPTEHVHC